MNFDQAKEQAILKKVAGGANKASATKDFEEQIMNPKYKNSIELTLVHEGFATKAVAKILAPIFFQEIEKRQK